MSRHRETATGSSRQAGLSSVEVIIMATVMSVLMIMVTESMTTLTGVRAEQRTQFRLGDVADGVVRRIEKEVDFAKRIFTDNAIDNDYLAAMDLDFDPIALGRRLPKLTTHGFFEPDAAAQPETGNVLFVARRLPRVAVKYDTIAEYHLQVLQFAAYLPIDVGGHLDLLRWTSDMMVDYWDIVDVADLTARADVLTQLYDNGVRYAWDATSPRVGGLFEITAAGGMTPLAADKQVTGREDAALSRPLGRRRIQIAPNGVLGPHHVPAYAQATGGFPGGFELKVDGAVSGKLVLIRLVTQSTHEATHQVVGEILRFMSTQG